jgi:hypothetical protein
MMSKSEKKKKNWKKSKPPKLTKIVTGYGLKSGEMLRGLKEFNKASFSSSNEEVIAALDWTEYNTRLGKRLKKAYKAEKHAGWGRDYPGSPMIDESFELTDGEMKALVDFKAKKPFRASKQEYLDMIQELFIDLASTQKHKAPAVMHTGVWEYQKGVSSFYTPHVVVLTGAKSVITALHEYTHSIGYGEVVAVRWSTNAFRILFPKAFGKLEQHPHHSHLLRRKRPPTEDAPENAETTVTDLGD